MLGLAIDNGFEPVTKEPRANTMEAIALLEEVVAKDDTHFGAHHYLIHAYEGSKMPEKAWHAIAAVCRARHQHPARAAHAGSHLRAERQDPGSHLGVLGRRRERAEVARVRHACTRTGTTATTSTS